MPVAFLGANFFEWFLHTHIMHRPQKLRALRAIYMRHTMMHHQFFTDDEMRFAGQHDWRVTFFPPFALVTFICMSVPIALVAGWLFSANVGWLLMATTTSMYLIYEFMHFCCHVDENWFVRNMPFVNTIRRHHTAHHNQSLMMERNMNLTFPIMDWLMGTSDLNRGLLGHVFNGYGTDHVKTDMRRTARTPDGRLPEPSGGRRGVGIAISDHSTRSGCQSTIGRSANRAPRPRLSRATVLRTSGSFTITVACLTES